MKGKRIVKEEEVGKVYGNWNVKDVFKKRGRTYFLVVCGKGHEREVRADVIIHKGQSCPECEGNPLYKSRTYNSWDSMVQRVTNPNDSSYYKYGEIGIGCHPDWLLPKGEGFRKFLEYMGEAPEGYTIDRWPDRSGGYFPGNVRWASNSEQGFNQKRRSTNTSGRTGVGWDNERGLWVAAICVNRKNIFLGRYEKFECAVKAREEAELKYFGEIKEEGERE